MRDVGPGGIGKTRLALAVAATQTAAFAEGVAFVALAAVSTSNQIISAIGDALRLSFAGQADPTTELLNYLRQRHMLLVLDSLEHLLRECLHVHTHADRISRPRSVSSRRPPSAWAGAAQPRCTAHAHAGEPSPRGAATFTARR